VAVVPTLLVYAVLAGALKGVPFNVRGGMSLPVLFYAFWEPLVAMGIILVLLWQFGNPSRAAVTVSRWSPSAYAAFVLHAPLVVGVGLMLQSLGWPPLVKFVVAGSLSVLASFGLGAALRRLPGVARVL
jgi:hypothetical protein